MDPIRIFRDYDLTELDAVAFAKAFQVCSTAVGWNECWDLSSRALAHPIFNGFNTSNKQKLLYRSRDAQPLLLALSGRYFQDARPIIVRRHCCTSRYCLNPLHFYYGTRADVTLETNKRKNTTKPRTNIVTPEVIDGIMMAKIAGNSILKISRRFRIPYHTVRRIYSGETYADPPTIISEKYLNSIKQQTMEICSKISQSYPNASKELQLATLVMEKSTCPWHRKGSNKHKGNFGLMGECLDCMDEIWSGRCTVDVTQFDLDWHWTVKRFWEQVDIKGVDECWPWLGTTRRNNSESIAYFPSPHHSGKTQSAPRVAYWLSRGYTGKYKVFSKPDCQSFCCNPTHLTIREFKDMLPPSEIKTIKLKHDNIFEHARKNLAQGQSGSAQ